MQTFIVLLLAHLLGDFPLQTNRVFRMKLASKRGLAVHVAIHIVVLIFLLQSPWQYLPLLIVLAAAHFFTDWLKVRLQKTGKPLTPGFLLDQVAHLTTIGVIASLSPDVMSILPTWMLLTAVFLAVLPALFMVLYIWANDVRQKQGEAASLPVRWASQRLILISQYSGWMVTGLIIAAGLWLAT